MMDDVFKEAREDNFIQIVTDNTPNYKEIAYLLIQKRKKLY